MSAAASTYAKAFDAVAAAAQSWANASGGSGCPVRVFGNGGACVTTARRQVAAAVGVALQMVRVRVSGALPWLELGLGLGLAQTPTPPPTLPLTQVAAAVGVALQMHPAPVEQHIPPAVAGMARRRAMLEASGAFDLGQKHSPLSTPGATRGTAAMFLLRCLPASAHAGWGAAMRCALSFDDRRCAYVYLRERPSGGKLSLTGPNPLGGVHCAQCPRIHVSLEAVGASIADVLYAANLSCAGVNSLPDASGGADAVLRGLAAGAARGNAARRSQGRGQGQGQWRPTFHWLKFEPDVGAEHANALQMMLAATSPLLISERGSLWPDSIGIARRASGLRTIMLHTAKAGGPIAHEDVSTCPGELVRGSCLLQGKKPYPGRGGCCEDCSPGHDQ